MGLHRCSSVFIRGWNLLFPGIGRGVGAAVLLLLGACAFAAENPIRFRNATDASGIKFVHFDGSTGRRYFVEQMTAGVGLIDYDGDGWLDILFLNGGLLPGTPKPDKPPTNELYRNNHDGTFTDMTAKSGVGLPGYAMGCTVADYDNDGHEDIFISNYGAHRLMHNNGDGTFTDVTAKAGLTKASFPECVGAGCTWLDYDRDGRLDLFVGNYLAYDIAIHQPCLRKNVPSYCGPTHYPKVINHLFHNNGDGTFTEVTEASGIGRFKAYCMGVVCSDFDGDGWPDIYVGNDAMENFLFHNKHDGTFEEIGLMSGTAVDMYGDPQGTMSANVGDYDGDGRFDILVTAYKDQITTLYRNLGNMQFQDVTVQTGAGTGSMAVVRWGGGLVDFDNDGVPEIFTAAGHLLDNVEQYDKTTTYKQRSLLLQQRNGRFAEITAGSGAIQAAVESSRGAVFGDLNNDGKIDIVVLNARSKPSVFMNETATKNHWSLLKLVGTKSNRSAVGALARVTAGGRTLANEVRAGRGYQSAEDLRLHFGLGASTSIDRVDVRWPSGMTNSWTNLTADRVLRLTEGKAEAETK